MYAGRIFLSLIAIFGVTAADISDVECPENGIIFLPHETNCNLYYGCFDGVAYLMMCNPGNCFDDYYQQCIEALESTTEVYISMDTSTETSWETSTDTSADIPIETTTEVITVISIETTTDISTETIADTSTEIITDTSTETITEASTETSPFTLTDTTTDISTETFICTSAITIT
ncbi:hypothetical protein Trydic_g16572 [Trypoxylus dichotomus]